MSTQHPDNVRVPFFAQNGVLGGEDEIQEAYYAFSHLGCDEQMWDFEGKEVDNFVVKKLLTKNPTFFKKHTLGKDIRLTFRVPNPEVERAEAKILLETLESIPRSYDVAQLFSKEPVAPVFEVILPMCTDALALNRIYHYYKEYVAGKQDKFLQGKMINEWIGTFNPKTINVIPLFEDKEHMLGAAEVLKTYVKDKQLDYQRVFLARSDPALNYGSLSAVLINKIALQRIHKASQEVGIPFYPIIGVGSAPFRGNFRPQTVDQVLSGYPSVHTYTVQSSFKFDHDPQHVHAAIQKIKRHVTNAPTSIDENRALDIIERYSKEYQRQLRQLAPIVNKVSKHVPARRRRKLHIGLFGYSRSMDNISLPRAIKFTCSFYSFGVPPEILGLNALTNEDWKYIDEVYPNFRHDISEPLAYTNYASPFLPAELKQTLSSLKKEDNKSHHAYTSPVATSLFDGAQENFTEHIVRAAEVRGFLG